MNGVHGCGGQPVNALRREALSELLSQPIVQALLAVALLMVCVYVGIQVISRLRAATFKTDTNAEDLATNFEEMCLEGDIDEAELRKIKAVLGKTQVTEPSRAESADEL